MVYLTRKAEFSASHYYHNPEFTPEENRRVFGKCNNPNGHGHNYTLEVTVKGEVDPLPQQRASGISASNPRQGKYRYCDLAASAVQAGTRQAAPGAGLRNAGAI